MCPNQSSVPNANLVVKTKRKINIDSNDSKNTDKLTTSSTNATTWVDSCVGDGGTDGDDVTVNKRTSKGNAAVSDNHSDTLAIKKTQPLEMRQPGQIDMVMLFNRRSR